MARCVAFDLSAIKRYSPGQRTQQRVAAAAHARIHNPLAPRAGAPGVSFIPSHSVIGEITAPRLAFVLHGVLGSSQNWRSFTKRLHGSRPEWCFVLVDTRHHGRSRPAPGPDTLEQCALDLRALAVRLGREPDVVIGHSLGGKIALDYTRLFSAKLDQVWSLDSSPGASPGAMETDHEVVRVLRVLRGVPLPLSRREDVIPTLMDAGLSESLARWMTTSTERVGDGYRWSLDLEPIESLLRDYFERDLWPVLEATNAKPRVHVVVAERSDRCSPQMRERARALEPAGRVKTHLVPDAGHWLHVDNPDYLRGLLAAHLPH